MSIRVLVLNRLLEVTRRLEATATYAVLSEEGELNWADPIHVKRDEDPSRSPRAALMMFEQLAPKAKRSGTAFELSPDTHCLILPVPAKGKKVALASIVVHADDRLAFYMLELAKLLLQREVYFAEGSTVMTWDE